MPHYSRFLLPAALLLSLAACQSGPSQNQAATATGPAAAPSAPADTARAVASSPGTWYRVYRGVLPDRADSVTLHLVMAPAQLFAYGRGPSYQGSYYGSDGHPYAIQSRGGTPAGSVVLYDVSPEHATGPQGDGPTWHLRLQADGSLAGTIAQRAVRLHLVPAPAGSLTFAVRYFADSLALQPKVAASPRARLSMQALLPTGGLATPREALATSMLRDLRGDTAATAGSPPPLLTLYQQRRAAYFTDYRAAAADMPAPTDTADAGSYRASLNYEQQSTSYVLFRQGDLLSVAYFSYDYSGGAHGNYGTTAASYDVRTGRRLRYADIFRPGAAAQLPALLARAVRPLVGLKPTEPLDKELLVKQLPLTRNVFLTTGGVEFIYQPYEIAAYAQGEVRVFLPLGQVRSLLRPGLPLPEVPSVAAVQH